MSFFIVTIDGPAASGKSTVSRKVAAVLHGMHVDSGSLYRGLTWKCLQRGVACNDEDAVLRLAQAIRMDFFLDAGSVRFTIDGEDPGAGIRSEEVGEQASVLAALPRVRAWIVERLRDMPRFGNLVIEGRDIGTVVFPDAPLKFFLDADPEVRARRRQGDLAAGNGAPSIERIKTALLRRDALDSSRAVAPLARAADAQVIDTTNSTVEEVVAAIVNAVQEWRK